MKDKIDAEKFRSLLRNGRENSGRITFFDFAKAINRWPPVVTRTLADADQDGTIKRSKTEEWKAGLEKVLGRPVELHEFTVEKRTNGNGVIDEQKVEPGTLTGGRGSRPPVALLEAPK